jgi:mRNA-degrading endonuclease RelE of RelBE toxin-antitoxin system
VSWTVVLTACAQRDLRRLDRSVATHILDALARLQGSPRVRSTDEVIAARFNS